MMMAEPDFHGVTATSMGGAIHRSSEVSQPSGDLAPGRL
jgi:hypothetical protein